MKSLVALVMTVSLTFAVEARTVRSFNDGWSFSRGDGESYEQVVVPHDWAIAGPYGERVQLKGVDLHSDLGPLGMAFNCDAMRRQLAVMIDMGANALRTSHNPPAPEVLDLCDELGIFVWNECFDKWNETCGRGKIPLIIAEAHTNAPKPLRGAPDGSRYRDMARSESSAQELGINGYALRRMARHLNRRSQRRYRLKFADTYYGELNHYGMYWLKWANVRRVA